MFHLFKNTYIEDCIVYNDHQLDKKKSYLINKSSGEICMTSDDIMNIIIDNETNSWRSDFFTNNKYIIICDFDAFVFAQCVFWKSVLKNNSLENLYWLHCGHIKDMRIKSTTEVYSQNVVEYIRQYRFISKDDFYLRFKSIPSYCVSDEQMSTIGVEYLLGNHLSLGANCKYESAFFDKIEFLSWKQIVQEFFVIRNQLVNGLYNNLNLVLPRGYHLDYSEDIEAQIICNPYLSWMYDLEFREDNIEYIKETYDIGIFSVLYDNWIKYRRPKERNPELELELDNLKWITDAIKASDWKLLLEQNLKRDFGCIYVDNWLIHKANQLWTGKVYREYNHSKEKKICSRFILNG